MQRSLSVGYQIAIVEPILFQHNLTFTEGNLFAKIWSILNKRVKFSIFTTRINNARKIRQEWVVKSLPAISPPRKLESTTVTIALNPLSIKLWESSRVFLFHNGNTPFMPTFDSNCSRYSLTSSRKISPKTTDETALFRFPSNTARTLFSYSLSQTPLGTNIFSRGKSNEIACCSIRTCRTR